ncbi:MAG: phage portal protein [Alphaproteobacteria bacterium]|nr:phage portal protein [Alphaproteobacteria bacterium]
MINLLKHFNNRRAMSESITFYNSGSDPRWTPCEYESMSETGFQKNVIAFRAINLISRGIASIPMRLRKIETSKEKEKHNETENKEDIIKAKIETEKLNTILNHPNSRQSRGTFFEYLVNYLLISGNAFIYWNKNEQMMCLRSDRVHIVPNASKTDVDFYLYNVDSTQFKIEKSDLLHLKFFNPLNDWYGLSPLHVASRAIDQHNAMSNHNLSILQNGGRPSGCLTVKTGSENLTEEQREQLRYDVRKAYSGTLNAGKIMVLEGDFEWKEMGLSPKDLDFASGKDLTTREIAQAFGVPPILVGIHGDSGFSNYKEARLHFWEDTILPFAELIRLELERWLSEKLRKNVEIVFDLDKIHALTSRRDILWQKIADANFLTINEKRELLGFCKLNSAEYLKNEKEVKGIKKYE